MTDTPRTPSLPLRRLSIIVAVWLVAAGGALLVAGALDSPVGAGERDVAQPAAPGPLAADEPGAGGGLDSLPPLALVLDRPLPDGIGELPPIRQAGRLRDLATADAPARRHVELGSVLQILGDGEGALAAYRRALRIGGDDAAARAGIVLTKAAEGEEGAAQAARGLAVLARRHPRDQLVAFNQGWLEVYRRRPEPARRAWERTVALGQGTRLGLTARALVEALGNMPSGRNP